MSLEKIITVLKLTLLVSVVTIQGAETDGTCGFFGNDGDNEILFLALLIVVAVLILVQSIAFAVIAGKVLRALNSYKEVSHTRRSRSKAEGTTITSYYGETAPAERGIEMAETQPRKDSSKTGHDGIQSAPMSTYGEMNRESRPDTNYEALQDTNTIEVAKPKHEPNQKRQSRFSKMPEATKNGAAHAPAYDNPAGTWGLY